MTVIDLVVCFTKVLSGLLTSLDDEDDISVFRPATYTFNGTHIADSDLRAIATPKSVDVHVFTITNVLTADVRIHPMKVNHIRLPGITYFRSTLLGLGTLAIYKLRHELVLKTMPRSHNSQEREHNVRRAGRLEPSTLRQ